MNKYAFSRHNATPSDTGWYGCGNRDVTIIPEVEIKNDYYSSYIIENLMKILPPPVYNNTEASWIYFYVSSPNSSFVEEDEKRTVIGFANLSAILPCRPTRPDLQVVLYNEDKRKVIEIKDNISYDPKLGFILNYFTKEDSGRFSCNITRNDMQYKISYQLHVREHYSIKLVRKQKKAYYRAPRGSEAMFIANFYSPTDMSLLWSFPSGYTLVVPEGRYYHSKYTTFTATTLTSLIIHDLNISDEGVYEFQVTSANLQISLNFTLEVSDKPYTIIAADKKLYVPGQLAEMECSVTARQTPNITWSSRSFYSFKKNADAMVSRILPFTIAGKPFPFYAKLNMSVIGPDIINCTACTSDGCDSDVVDISVSEANADFTILKPEEPIIEGDNISIICTAPIYVFTDDITWIKGSKRGTIEKNGNMNVVKEETSYNYRSTLIIQKVRKEDEDVYTCAVKTRRGYLLQKEYILFVYDGELPMFINSNLKGGNLTINLQKEHKDIFLHCNVNGIPKPSVTWYKDDVLLKQTKQYLLSSENRELHINYYTKEDSGKYSCRATNHLGTIEDYINITIEGDGTSKGTLIIVISTILVMLMIILILGVYVKMKVRREKITKKELSEAGLMNFEEGVLENLNPDLTINDQAEFLPYDKKWEFPREQLKLGKQLGSGAFGVVMKAEAVGIHKDENITTVAVKMVRPTADPIFIRALARELKIMVHLGKHLNVVNLLGACTKNISKRELFVIVEYCRFGNLHNYLLNHRTDFINQIDPATGKFDFKIGMDRFRRTTSTSSNNISASPDIETMAHDTRNSSDSLEETISTNNSSLSNNSSQSGWRSNYRGDCTDKNVLKPICTQDLLSWAFQVARGMEYLSEKKVLHGDLAARNILLAKDNIVKICDFGLAKALYKYDNYKRKGNKPLPIKWMAIESIRDQIFSTQSDVWSFGIVLWEFFTLAQTPYPGIEFEALYEKLITGYRMQPPAYATRDVYKIMLRCWNAKPMLRPTFTELVDCIGDLLEERIKAHYISLNSTYVDMNRITSEGKIDYLTMMTSPDHATLSSFERNYEDSPDTENVPESTHRCTSPKNPTDESDVCSLRPNMENSCFECSSTMLNSEDDVELPPLPAYQHRTLKNEENLSLKTIDIHVEA